MPFEGDDTEAPTPGEMREARKHRFDGPKRHWWRPKNTLGRALLGFGALVVLAALTTGYVFAKRFLERDLRFRIAGADNIQAAGLSEVSRAEILPVFGEDIGRNVFFVPLAERRKQLEQIPWVQHATVMRLLPDQIRVTVVERQPVAFVRHGGQIGLVDASGVLLTMPAGAMAQHHYSFPVLTGIDAADSAASRKARVDLYLRMMHELDSTGQHLSDQLSEIDLTDQEDARVTMPEQGTDILAHFGEDHFLDRYQRYKAHIGEWKQQYPKLAGVDLRYDQQVVLQMTQGASADDAPANDAAKPDTAQAKATAAAPVKPAETAKNDPPKTAQKNTAKADNGKKTESAKAETPKGATKTPAKPETVKSSVPKTAESKSAPKVAENKTPAKAQTGKAKAETARADAPKTGSAAKKAGANQATAAKTKTANAGAPAKGAKAKPAGSTKTAKADAAKSANAKTPTAKSDTAQSSTVNEKSTAQTKEERVQALAEQMRKKHDAAQKKAAAQKKTKNAPKAHATSGKRKGR